MLTRYQILIYTTIQKFGISIFFFKTDTEEWLLKIQLCHHTNKLHNNKIY